jgi:ubiquinone/menaquinone biosynthesis C-methylase UbiE
MEMISSDKIEVFEKYANEYDKWFDDHAFAYKSEILALSKFIPKNGKGLEIGSGTGRFAIPLGIRYGIEPAKSMAQIARERGIEIYEAMAEKLPFVNGSFDFVLMVTTLCFLQNPLQAFQEIRRVLEPGGFIVIGTLDKNSSPYKEYESKMDKSQFFQHAYFYSVDQIIIWVRESGFVQIRSNQTIFKNPEDLKTIEKVKDGYGDGIFVVISAQKGNER